MSSNTSLANHLLIAMPSLAESPFSQSVIYVCEHHTQGTVGLIINKPMQFPLGLVFDQLQIEPLHVESNRLPLLFGGPLQTERGFVIHRPLGGWRSSLPLQEGVTITTSNDIIRAIAQETGPKDVLVTMGYAGWAGEQLDKEIMDNLWLVCPYKPELLYDVPFEKRWEYAGLTIGVKMNQLSSVTGHA
jgi:putative transcriptional regulator